jgi:hypothetical protein
VTGLVRAATGLAATLLLAAVPVTATAAPTRPPSRVPPALTESQASAHFVIHYTSAGEPRDRWDPAAAPGLLDLLERARQAYLERGFPAPVDDGDGHADVYIFDCSRNVVGNRSYASPDGPPPGSGWFCLIPDQARGDRPVPAHELFHLVQFALGGRESGWPNEAFAVWAERELFPLRVTVAGAPPLDCAFRGGPASCDEDRGGYLRWSWFTHFAERYGMPFVRDLAGRLFHTPAPADPIGEISGALAAKGTSLRAAVAGYGGVIAAGDARTPSLTQGPTTRATVALGATGGTVPLPSQAVDHLNVRYAQVTTGEDQPPACTTGTLAVTVHVPAGVADVVPVGVLPTRGPAQELPVHDGVAAGQVVMSSCERAVIAFPNGSRDIDAAPFSGGVTWSVGPPAPLLTRVSLVPSRVRPAVRGPALGGARLRGRGAVLRLTADRAGLVRVRIYRLSGARRTVRRLDASRSIRKGDNRLTVNARAGSRALTPGAYALELTPTAFPSAAPSAAARAQHRGPATVRRFVVRR